MPDVEQPSPDPKLNGEHIEPEAPEGTTKAFRDTLTEDQKSLLYGNERPNQFGDDPKPKPDQDEEGEEEVDAEPAELVEAETTEVDEAPAPEFDDELLDIAGSYGFSEDDARSFGTPDNLTRALMAIARREKQRGVPAEEPAEERPAPKSKPKAVDWDALAEKFDPDVVNAMKSTHELAQAEIAALKAKVGDFETVEQKRERQRQYDAAAAFERKLDEGFNALPEEYKDIYGKGPSLAMKSTDRKRFAEREKHYKVMQALLNGRVANDFDTAFKMALAAVTGTKAKQVARTEVAKALQKRAKTTIAKPTERKIAERTTGRDMAARRIDEFNKKHGNPGAFAQDIDDEF